MLGVRCLKPVLTRRTHRQPRQHRRMRANAIEAAGAVRPADVPECHDPALLAARRLAGRAGAALLRRGRRAARARCAGAPRDLGGADRPGGRLRRRGARRHPRLPQTVRRPSLPHSQGRHRSTGGAGDLAGGFWPALRPASVLHMQPSGERQGPDQPQGRRGEEHRPYRNRAAVRSSTATSSRPSQSGSNRRPPGASAPSTRSSASTPEPSPRPATRGPKGIRAAGGHEALRLGGRLRRRTLIGLGKGLGAIKSEPAQFELSARR